ncbi:MAG: hypothetical protein Pg6C_02700 [Treponemataceae bacterium]|nr:MAG: hypothetical protein Pg6C_02700 [Treponemataceae bacterium]
MGTKPDYVLQRHAISRSIHSLSATAIKLTAMASSLLPFDLSERTAKFTLTEFCQSIGLAKGGNSYKIFEAAVNECMEHVITIDTPSGWEKFTWFSKAKFNKKSGEITMIFSDVLAEHLLAMKKMYAKINLIDLGKLSSRYAIRIFELAVSYASLAGQNGNAFDCWYFEREIPELRTILAVDTQKYPMTKDFRKNVIDLPVKEINNAGIGISIETEYKRMGKFLHSVRFHCKKTARTQSALPFFNSGPESREEKELEKLKKLYPDEYAELFKDEMGKKEPFPFLDEMKPAVAGYKAALRLKELKGIKK